MDHKEKYNSIAYGLLAAAFGYTLSRSITVPVFHDEAVTYYYLARLPYLDILDYGRQVFAPTNHLLNTILMKFFTQFLGVSEFTIRIPALIGHLLYLTATYRILRLVVSAEIFLGGIVLLNFNPFLLELFSAARGYALGLGFLGWAIFYFLKQIGTKENDDRRQSILKASVMLALAILSSFSFIQVYLSFLVVIFGYEYSYSRASQTHQKPLRTLKDCFVKCFSYFYLSIMIISICAVPILIVRDRINFWAFSQGQDGFWKDTVTSLIQATLYGSYQGNVLLVPFIKIMVAVLWISVLMLALKHANGRSKDPLGKYLTGLVLWSGATVGYMFFQWQIFKIKYVVERHAVFLIPFFMIILVGLWSYTKNINSQSIRKITQAVFGILTLVAVFHFVHVADFTRYYLCSYAASAKNMLEDIREIRKEQGSSQKPAVIATHWLLTPMINFYRIKDNLTWLKPLPYRPLVHGDEAYFYLFSKESPYAKGDADIEADLHHSDQLNLKIVKEYNSTATYLATRNN